MTEPSPQRRRSGRQSARPSDLPALSGIHDEENRRRDAALGSAALLKAITRLRAKGGC
ncbi:MAG TPA: hypothetical protein VF628_02285 [Allosphingosinicella sp.]|jgi:hypothetical protein